MRSIILFFVISILTVSTLMRNGVWSDEIRLLKDVVRKSPGNARAWHNLGIHYLNKGMLSKAEDAIRRAMTIIPEPVIFVNLGDYMAKQGRYDDAVLLYHEALKRAEDKDVFNDMKELTRFAAYVAMGNLYLEFKNDYSMAEFYYRKALEVKPDSGKVWCNLGYALIMQKRCEEALNVLEHAQRLIPEDRLTIENIGLARECLR